MQLPDHLVRLERRLQRRRRRRDAGLTDSDTESEGDSDSSEPSEDPEPRPAGAAEQSPTEAVDRDPVSKRIRRLVFGENLAGMWSGLLSSDSESSEEAGSIPDSEWSDESQSPPVTRPATSSQGPITRARNRPQTRSPSPPVTRPATSGPIILGRDKRQRQEAGGIRDSLPDKVARLA